MVWYVMVWYDITWYLIVWYRYIMIRCNNYIGISDCGAESLVVGGSHWPGVERRAKNNHQYSFETIL